MSANDVRDILDLNNESNNAGPTKASIIKQGQVKKKKSETIKRPEGMHRELFALLYSDNRDQAPLIPTDTSQEYQTAKVKLGCKQVRPWKWMQFTNPGRKDGAMFYHWRRAEDEGKDYPFAKFNKTMSIPVYSDQEYQLNLVREDWTKEETDHLLELCKRFDLRWFVIHDRYDHHRFSPHKPRALEEMKDRYYSLCNELAKMRSNGKAVKDLYVYDIEHEIKRKEQLERLFSRTREQVKEEEMLLNELKKIDTRKKERERKAQDLKKLIAAADSGAEVRRAERKSSKKKQNVQKKETPVELKREFRPLNPPRDQAFVRHFLRKNQESSSVIKFPDYKGSGVMLRSQRMKIPNSVAQKKVKAVEQLLTEFDIDLHPMPTPGITDIFNELRSDMILLYDFRMAHVNLQMELQTLRYKWDALAPGKIQGVKMENLDESGKSLDAISSAMSLETLELKDKITSGSDTNDVIDVVGTLNSRKRQLSLDETEAKKTKSKMQ